MPSQEDLVVVAAGLLRRLLSAIGTGGGTFESISAILKHCSLDYVCLPTSYTVRPRPTDRKIVLYDAAS
jgi:hypothetical protein